MVSPLASAASPNPANDTVAALSLSSTTASVVLSSQGNLLRKSAAFLTSFQNKASSKISSFCWSSSKIPLLSARVDTLNDGALQSLTPTSDSGSISRPCPRCVFVVAIVVLVTVLVVVLVITILSSRPPPLLSSSSTSSSSSGNHI